MFVVRKNTISRALRTAKNEERTAVHLPRRLRNSRNLAPQCQSPEAQSADAELAEIGPRTPANLAAIVLARRKLRKFPVARFSLALRAILDSFCCSCHLASSSWLLASSNLFRCKSWFHFFNLTSNLLLMP